MKKIIFLCLVIFIGSNILHSQSRGLGIGLAVGSPTGLSSKIWVTNSGAVQLGFGWQSINYHHGNAFSVDYLWHSNVIRSREAFPIFYGLGGIIGTSYYYNLFGARGVFGIAWLPRNSHIDVFFQLVPTLYINPTTDFDFEFGAGVRYFF